MFLYNLYIVVFRTTHMGSVIKSYFIRNPAIKARFIKMFLITCTSTSITHIKPTIVMARQILVALIAG